MSATARATRTTIMLTTASPARITGPRKWSRKPFTSLPTGDLKRRSESAWNIGRSGAKSCNEARTKRVKPLASETGEQARMYQVDQGAYWQAQTIYWGPKILIAILILIATWVVARAVKWVLQKAIDR